jgi:hypothetical protein
MFAYTMCSQLRMKKATLKPPLEGSAQLQRHVMTSHIWPIAVSFELKYALT